MFCHSHRHSHRGLSIVSGGGGEDDTMPHPPLTIDNPLCLHPMETVITGRDINCLYVFALKKLIHDKLERCAL